MVTEEAPKQNSKVSLDANNVLNMPFEELGEYSPDEVRAVALSMDVKT